ncbi:hypothetical protein [Leptospira sp. 'Mane']|uniref:hypothetical protein n=1 Tax=Leptospira sp. 'Mane' TaxID=3387407 RepID=UPI00398B82CC
MTEFTIPVLPCSSVKDMIRFYKAIGFEIIEKQISPDPSVHVRFGGIEIYFYETKQQNSKDSSGTCYVLTSDVGKLYRSFADSIKRNLGEISFSRSPKVTPVKKLPSGKREFNLIDPGGNRIRIQQRIEKDRVASLPHLKKSKSFSGTKNRFNLSRLIFPYL